MSDEKKISLPYEWAIKETLGPTLKSVGVDLEQLYQKSKKGVTLIALVAKRKIQDKKGLKANLRVTRDVFWNGSFSDEAICAEYFGGVLAASRTEDGHDDTGIHYTDIIKSLSSKQLHLHYLVYNSFNKLLLKNPSTKILNVGLQSDVQRDSTFFFTAEILQLGIDTSIDFTALHTKGLIGDYMTEPKKLDESNGAPLTRVAPTTLGIQLYAVANNELKSWRQFPTITYQDFPDIALPKHYELKESELEKTAKKMLGIKDDK